MKSNRLSPLPRHTLLSSRHPTHLLYGFHAVCAAWLNPLRRCHHLFVTRSGLKSIKMAMDQAKRDHLDRPYALLCDRHDLDQLIPGAVHQGLILDASPLPESDIHIFQGQADVIVLDHVTDPHNIGAILRSVSVFNGAGVILTHRHCPWVTGTMAKSACGAVEHISLVRVANLAHALQRLQVNGYQCIGLADQAEHCLFRLDLHGPTAFILGAEGTGLRNLITKRCDFLARIPTSGPITSLNVSNVAALALYEKARQTLYR